MARHSSVSDNRLPSRLATMIAVSAMVAFGLALAVAGVLWFRYGTAVFFQTLAAGIAACF
jgi:hypothetical protein